MNHGSDHRGLPVGRPGSGRSALREVRLQHAHRSGHRRCVDVGAGGHPALLAGDGSARRRGPIRCWFAEGDAAGSVHVPQRRDGKAGPGTAVAPVSIADARPSGKGTW